MTLLCLVFLRWAVTPSRPQKFAGSRFSAQIFASPQLFDRCLAGDLGERLSHRGVPWCALQRAAFGLRWRFTMPVLLGFILGVAVTILGVYEYDSTTGRAG